MEGYVFVLMANSGTDPDLEAEDETSEAGSTCRVTVNDEDDQEYPGEVSSVDRLIERANARLMMAPDEQDRDCTTWRCYEKMPSPPASSPRSIYDRKFHTHPSRSEDLASIAESSLESLNIVSLDETADLPDISDTSRSQHGKLSADPDWQQTWQRTLFRPASFQICSTASSYTSLPPLKLALPSVPRNPFPMAPIRRDTVKDTRASLLLQQQSQAIHNICSKAPAHPVHGLFHQSNQVLKKHYQSLRTLCYLKMHKLETENNHHVKY